MPLKNSPAISMFLSVGFSWYLKGSVQTLKYTSPVLADFVIKTEPLSHAYAFLSKVSLARV